MGRGQVPVDRGERDGGGGGGGAGLYLTSNTTLSLPEVLLHLGML